MMQSTLAPEDPRSFAEVVKEVPPPDEHEHEEDGQSPDGKHSDIPTSVDSVPVTKERPVYVPDDKSKLGDTGVPRANQAATRSHPQGTTANSYNKKHANETVLQQHCAFFDRDGDGVIWPQDTFRGFYQLGFGLLLSAFSMWIIHTFFAYPTQTSWVPDPLFRVHVRNIHRDKHGSDSGAYDNEGRFVPEKFEDFFEKYSSLPGKDGLTVWDTVRAIVGQRCILDPVGWGAVVFEWLATWILLRPRDWVIRKEQVRGVYDGSIFWNLAAERKGVKVHQ
ncbi:Caleosin-domain-containing protein [Gloeophyllum trabeum ATCC 11539]|uniref:Caleosin-domain-containing protein n=1 Tax=Gloeophyllum trabeum (strain ATCC 11539 / FP-39264 / Madison 617) TaxID=670483 RepID=S7QKD5_GLOTA|nr:Caleosin-domain-containing protein [Gloeophyllum trabeum ATCC 11539]EPQ60216.1 Caleosin-domain-containing protein [Gloeophyllum trabeum ATCC 11539]